MRFEAKRGDLSRDVVSAHFASKSAKAVTALAWRANLSMRQVLQIQLRIAHPARRRLNLHSGTDYPLTPSEMKWQLRLFVAAQDLIGRYCSTPAILSPSSR